MQQIAFQPPGAAFQGNADECHCHCGWGAAILAIVVKSMSCGSPSLVPSRCDRGCRGQVPDDGLISVLFRGPVNEFDGVLYERLSCA